MNRRQISTADAEEIYGIPARTIRRWYTEGRVTQPEMVKGRLMWNHEEIIQMAGHRKGRQRLRRVACAGET